MTRHSHRKSAASHTIQSLPSLDVVLVLFIMLCALWPFFAGQSSDHGVIPPQTIQVQPEGHELAILLDRTDSLFVFNDQVWQQVANTQSMAKEVALLLKEEAKEVVLHVEEAASQAYVLEVIDTLESMNISAIGLVTIASAEGDMS